MHICVVILICFLYHWCCSAFPSFPSCLASFACSDLLVTNDISYSNTPSWLIKKLLCIVERSCQTLCNEYGAAKRRFGQTVGCSLKDPPSHISLVIEHLSQTILSIHVQCGMARGKAKRGRSHDSYDIRPKKDFQSETYQWLMMFIL